MTTTARKRKSPASKKAGKYIGDTTFESIGDLPTKTNEEHVKMLLSELAWMRMATVVLNKTDVELETLVRANCDDELTRQSFMDLADQMLSIGDRHAAAVEICAGARARILVIFDRCLNGPNPVTWSDAK
jgi:hypothetical protein